MYETYFLPKDSNVFIKNNNNYCLSDNLLLNFDCFNFQHINDISPVLSDLVTIDEVLFCSNHPPADALPLYLRHFQFKEYSDSKVSNRLSFFVCMCITVTYFLLLAKRNLSLLT